MNTAPLLDIASIDTSRPLLDGPRIRDLLPQRRTLALVDAVVFADVEEKLVAGYKDLREDDWWVFDHVPGHPILPGVLMLEAASQLAALELTVRYQITSSEAQRVVVGLVGIDKAKFRAPAIPPCRLLMVAKQLTRKRTLITYSVQGFIGGRPSFEAQVTGTVL